MSPLERRYRRLLRVLPRSYRRDRAEEMVATLLESRADRPDRGPGLAETVAVLGLAVRARLSTAAPARIIAAGNASRGIALSGLSIAGVWAVERLVDWLYDTAHGYPQDFTPGHLAVLLVGYLAVPATFTVALLGRIGWARVLGIVALIPGAIAIVTDVRFGHWSVFATDATTDVALWLAVACLFLPVTRGLRRASPLWWAAAGGAALLGTVFALLEATPMASMDADLWLRFFRDTVPGWVVALGCVGYLIAIGKRLDRAGSGALTLSAAALVTVLAQIAELLLRTYELANLAIGRFVVFTALTGMLLVFAVALGTIGVRRYWSLSPRHDIAELG